VTLIDASFVVVKIEGDMPAVRAAIEAGAHAAQQSGSLICARIIPHREHLVEGNAAVFVGQKADQQAVLLGFLAGVLDRGAGPFVGPARQRLAKVRGENRVRDFVRQHAVEQPLGHLICIAHAGVPPTKLVVRRRRIGA
jgi:hypothetical protein